MMFITLEEAKLHLRVDGDSDDSDITLKTHAASGSVRRYLKSAADPYFDEAGEVIPDKVPFEVKAATQLMLGYLFNQRDEDSGREFEPGYLPRPVTALLYPLRDPALA
ncbi:head-tail connector protein [Pseudomonas laurylsulfatiphila]|uniref:head-tail connector protein n=1 Tax=Pseudomonas laurylsulfatiphila TaxID=2011015 RepID=UPI00215DD89B|nr:head-tail connector protein [Pseudomonas laurylsulfatiphila]UVM07055.1 head-tail connector protein [Pseudomonas laurylsulfatiphila]